MKVRLADVKNAQPALQKLMNCDLSIKSAFKLSRIAKAVNNVLVDIEEQRVALVKKLGSAVDGDTLKVSEENVPQFAEEMEGFLKEEVEVVVEPIDMALLEQEDVKLSAVDMAALEPFLNLD